MMSTSTNMIRSRSIPINLLGSSEQQSATRSIMPFSSNSNSQPTYSNESSATFTATTQTSLALASVNINSPRSRQLRFLLLIAVIGIWFYAVINLTGNNPSVPLIEHKSLLRTARELTVVINTFKRPPRVVQEAVDFYAACEIVKHVYVIWSEKEPPPQQLTGKYVLWKNPTVSFQRQSTDSLNNRFKPLEGPHTDGIFAVDDDMRVPCEDLALAFQVWQGSRRSLVGYMPRVHIKSKKGLIYRCWWRVWWHGVYSIILTKAAILHHDFFIAYSTVMPQSIRNLVDELRNCEDIAMQFLIANSTGLPPIYVKGHLEDLGVFNGISTSKNVANAGHMGDRSRCLNSLTSIYGRVPLVISHVIVDHASNGWTNVPSSWWEFISSDLWKLE